MTSDYDYRPAAQRAYLDHLVGCGYQLSDFEKALLVEAEAEAAAEGMYDEGDDDASEDEAGGDGGEA